MAETTAPDPRADNELQARCSEPANELTAAWFDLCGPCLWKEGDIQCP